MERVFSSVLYLQFHCCLDIIVNSKLNDLQTFHMPHKLVDVTANVQ